MMDQLFDRSYQSGRAELNAGLDRGFTRIGDTVGKGLKALHQFEWSAPWATESKDGQCG